MNKTPVAQQAKTASIFPPTQGILQRKCACGNHTMTGGECTECANGKNGLQRKLAIGASHDPLEREADRVADQVMAAPAHSAVSGAPPRIQRFSDQSNGQMDVAPTSVDKVLASSGSPLDTTLQQDMGQRFGRDFSRVRVHFDAAAEQSARDVNAHAYTVGHNIVFGAGRFAPRTYEGRRLIAHELTHVVQQAGADEVGAGQGNANRGLSPIPRTMAGVLQRFEAKVHESGERVSLTQSGAMTNEEASAAYFGNWMRDMNQVFVPMLTDLVPSDVLFSLISYMAATKFGRELTPEQFGYYIPAEHLDNPGGLVALDDLLPSPPTISTSAQAQPPARLGATRPTHLDTPQEDVNPASATIQGVNIFAVDQAGVMAYIRRTNLHIERRLRLAGDIGRNPEGMMHFGAALHAVEDLFAHSNYVEIAVDRLLRTDATFLNQLINPADRQVFTYSTIAPVGSSGTTSEGRPVLTTGSFTGIDTQISIASEIGGFLSRPLPDPTTNEELEAQDDFMVALLRNFEARVRANPSLQRMVHNTFRSMGFPSLIADQADQLPLADIYYLGTLLGIRIPDAIRIPLKRKIRETVSQEVLQPLAGQIQAAGLEARVADTSLIRVLRDAQRQQHGRFSAFERESMRQREQFTGEPVAQQEADAMAAAGRRAQAIRSTPLHVVAGPSHSQIAKDHPNSPFFGLAFLLASIAVRRIRDRMLAVWGESHGALTTPFDFDWASFPQAAPSGLSTAQTETYEQARRLYHEGRPDRSTREQNSLQSGQALIAHGGQPDQPYELAVMRQQAATRIRTVAAVLRIIARSPTATATVSAQVRSVVGRTAPEVDRRLRQQLTQVQATGASVGTSQPVADLNTVATNLDLTAREVEVARRHQQREQANIELIQRRDEMLNAMARQPSLDTELALMLLYILNEEIQMTSVAYSSEQRAVLEGRQFMPEMGASPRGLSMQTLSLPAVTGSSAMQALLNESRLLVAHPYDNNWWVQPVRTYAQRFPNRLINDIEARNEGVPFYRSPGGERSHH